MKTKTARGFTLALITAIYFNTLLVIIKELVPAIKIFMKTYLFHHWLAHGLFVLLFFILSGVLFGKTNLQVDPGKTPVYLVSAIIIASLGISVFYIIHVH